MCGTINLFTSRMYRRNNIALIIEKIGINKNSKIGKKGKIHMHSL